MSLNIKNDYVHDLARKAALATGKSQTGAIQEALEALLVSYGDDPDKTRRDRKSDAARRIAQAYRADPGKSHPAIVAVDDLYDSATGLPQ